MTKTGHAIGDGLMAFYTDIDKDYMSQFRRWHNCQHMPERVSIPGFIEGRRYSGCEAGHDYLLMYETETADVLGGRAYLSALDNPSDWTREALTHFRNPLRGIYRLLSAYGESDFFAAPWLLTIRLDSNAGITAEQAETVLEDLREENIPSARFYEINDHLAQIKTAEKEIYGENNSYKRYLIFIESKYAHARKAIVEDRSKGPLAELLKQDEKPLIDEHSIEYYLLSPLA